MQAKTLQELAAENYTAKGSQSIRGGINLLGVKNTSFPHGIQMAACLQAKQFNYSGETSTSFHKNTQFLNSSSIWKQYTKSKYVEVAVITFTD